MHQSKHRNAGFTLIELMVAMAGFALVSLAAFSVLSTGQRTAVANDQLVKVQQTARLALDLMTRDIRMAGYGTPSGVPLPAGCNTPLIPTDGGPGGNDTVSVVTVDQVIGRLALDSPLVPGNVITLFDLPPGLMAVNDVITLDGVFTASVSAVDEAAKTLTLSSPIGSTTSPRVFLATTSVIRLICVTYSVSGAGANPPFQLMRRVGALAPGNQPIPIVDGIETIQLAYALDTDNDGRIDNQTGSVAGFDCLDFVPNLPAPAIPPPAPAAAVQLPCGPPAAVGTAAIPTSVAGNPTTARQVRLTVVARAIPPAVQYSSTSCWRDTSFTGASAMIVENTALGEPTPPAGCPPLAAGQPSGIRRRALTRVISLRDTTS
jgi:type IV pilus assembly protein PilW